MKALIYDPYLDTAGGGERYMLTASSILLKSGYNVDVWWKDKKIDDWLDTRLGIDLSKVNFTEELNHGLGYDLVFWLSDGSIPLLLGKKNIVHFQTPFTNVDGRSLFNRLKKTKINAFICNSRFTKQFVDKEYGVNSLVAYPPVNINLFKSGRKENIILFVGRYSQLQQHKRQDILIESFKKMCGSGLKNWRLVLIGGSEVGGREFVEYLKENSRGYPISILENLPLSGVREFYAKSKIFWSASGFGVDEGKEPHQVEHFGMTVVEAQSAKCVPIVVNKGGHKETIREGKNGFLWTDTQQLEQITLDLIRNERRRKEIAITAEKDSKRFSVNAFEKSIGEIFK
ncbi:MAG: hypothetical protein A3H88_01045 [Candidatus Blackburnbacteria bacterium RIFCSPLOWO2_02_FULL_44_9]|uniref:Glycosyl transferase family 1 domain-containing protein n=2 Tax=Microgenomates group TaxID=1794810 RepID=A0A0G0WFX4_9BACT|nr:MAG: hypothetical protein UU67_C0091G0003 [Candidatus Daviesbacteria bacterium GW2011_GWB1_41_5]OGY11704.1 MAG: hypothetical protein A3E16_00955 [Candidatus Blackburnbacteria bacterium RIFCSPHIGHO2_12_FULL_44_25]OGY11963.1 MAG: hypothetical protein A3D26_03160 [Candidatus Blackburnbacteria bacterium RIFCSPHIGHO2_02_FULL_44_20]OGY15968.1 MAG: hypothetical protein A3H88_01045 [Candidatus Blackburnbacteria bacterium RIFCSPLOWO2_02_FULL_44_9]